MIDLNYSGIRSPVLLASTSLPSPSEVQSQIDNYLDQILPIALIFVSVAAVGLFLRKL